MKRKADTPRRSKRDGLLAVAITGAISLLIAIAVPVGCGMSLMGNYHRFIQDLGNSLMYAREHGTLEMSVGGEMRAGDLDQAEKLYRLISETGMGSPLSELPGGEPLSLTFGDGSALQVFPTTINETDGTTAEGAIISYTRLDGHVFSYDTDKIAYQDILSRIGVSG
jgi:hypothetical protein